MKRSDFMNLIIGSHVSYNSTNGLVGSVKETLKYGANTFMFYTGAPQNTKRSIIDNEDIIKARELMKQNNIDINNIIVHAPYIVNLANNKDEDKYQFAINFLINEIKRTKQIGVSKIVLHPGSHVGLGEEAGIKNIINALNIILDSEEGPIICLETMAGKGTEIGKTFEQINQIIEGINYKNRIMVCLDTCHIHDAGYNLNDFDKILNEFDSVIGLEKLACLHINDSKNCLGSHKDRHENIGFGQIGFDNLLKIIYHEKLKELPKILETPYVKENPKDKISYPPYKEEIEMIKQKEFDENLLTKIINHNK